MDIVCGLRATGKTTYVSQTFGHLRVLDEYEYFDKTRNKDLLNFQVLVTQYVHIPPSVRAQLSIVTLHILPPFQTSLKRSVQKFVDLMTTEFQIPKQTVVWPERYERFKPLVIHLQRNSEP
jgi:lambda repressor-like predicted transcriptional regulator